MLEQAVRVATQYAPAPPAAAHLQSIAYMPYACGAQRALLPEYSRLTGSGSLWAVA